MSVQQSGRINPRAFVLTIVGLVALSDILTGLVWLLSAEPWTWAGHMIAWAELPNSVTLDPAHGRFLKGVYFRMGAYAFNMGVITAFWAWFARSNHALLSLLLVIYSINGLLILYADYAFLAGSAYFQLKLVGGAVWLLAIVAHFRARGQRRGDEDQGAE